MRVIIEAHALENLLDGLVKQAPYVAMQAINDTLFDARRDQIGNRMPKHMDGGATPWTKRGLRYDKAKKNYLQGTLYFHANRPYMNTIIKGGVVKPKKRKLVAPVHGKVQVNKFGNLTKNKIETLKNKPKHFVGKPSKRHSDDSYGIYREKGRGRSRKLERIVYMNLSQRQQRVTYEGDKYAVKYMNRVIQKNILRAARKAIRTAR